MTPRTPARRTLRDGAVIAVAMGVMNVTTYGFVILAARLLGPAEYGALGAVMGVLLVVNVLSLGLQATGARRVSAASEDLPLLEREVLATSWWSAIALGLLVLAATPLITATLNLDSWATAALVAATAVPLTVMGGEAGILQGERRWGSLAAVYLAVGLGRIGFGALGLLVRPDSVGAMVGVTVGAVVPAVIGWAALRHPDRHRDRRPVAPRPVTETLPGRARGGVLHETAHNSHALLAFFALSNADVVIARSTLPEHQAGLYAAGLILTKAVLFLPQFVVVIAFPSMARHDADRRMHLLSLAAVLAIGVVTTVGVAVLAVLPPPGASTTPLAVLFVGGPAYVGVQDRLWVFATLGTLLAMLQLMVYNVVARQRQRTVLLVWGALVALLVAAAAVDTLSGLLVVVVVVDALLFVVLLTRSVAPSYARDAVSEPPRASSPRSRPTRRAGR